MKRKKKMELKNNQGILFQNKKEKDSQPDFKGELNVDGNVFQIALWKKKSKNDNVYLSVQVEPKKEIEDKNWSRVKDKPKTVGEYLDEHKDNLDDEIPW